MAVDELVYRRYLNEGIGVLRLYSWKNPSFTYGFSQKPDGVLNLAACAADGVEVAKRITGGGVLFHDDEITYSFACSKSDVGEPQGVFVDYRNICRFLIHFYESLGLRAAFALSGPDFRWQPAPHEICSAAHEKYDIVIAGKKIGGHAQKRNRQVIFQHGAIPLRINWTRAAKYFKVSSAGFSAYATTLTDELNEIPPRDVLEQKLIDAFSLAFKIEFIEEALIDDQAGMVA